MEETRKQYEKPVVEKHEAIVVISGSGDSKDCNMYRSRTTENGYIYYH